MSLFWCLTEAWDPRLPVWKDQLWVDEGAVHHSQRHHLRPQRHRGAPAGKKCPNSLTCFHWLIFSTKNSSNPDFTSERSLTEVCSIVMTTGRTALSSVPTESRTFWSSDAHAADPRSAHPKPGHEGSHRCFYFGERMGGGLLTQFVQFSFILNIPVTAAVTLGVFIMKGKDSCCVRSTGQSASPYFLSRMSCSSSGCLY